MADITLKAMPFDAKEIIDPGTGETTFDRVAYSRDFADWMRAYFANGILVEDWRNLETQLQVTAGTGMIANIATGGININGRNGWLEQAETVLLDVGSANPRIDRIVAELNIPNDRGIYIKVLQGTPAAEPVSPELIRTEDVFQMSLARVRVNAGQATIASITDERSDPDVCGISYVKLTPKGNSASGVLVDNLSSLFYGQSVDAALDTIAGRTYMKNIVFTKSGEFIVPEGVTEIRLSGCAAGGPGGSGTTGTGTSGYGTRGAAGNAGAYIIDVIKTVYPGQILNITCGSGNTTIPELDITLIANSIAANFINPKLGLPSMTTLAAGSQGAQGEDAKKISHFPTIWGLFQDYYFAPGGSGGSGYGGGTGSFYGGGGGGGTPISSGVGAAGGAIFNSGSTAIGTSGGYGGWGGAFGAGGGGGGTGNSYYVGGSGGGGAGGYGAGGGGGGGGYSSGAAPGSGGSGSYGFILIETEW